MSLLPDAIADSRFTALDLLSQRLEGLALGVLLLVYLIDLVPASALPALAWQLHVEGYDSGLPVLEQRAMIRESVAVHRRYGTPWALRRVLELAGLEQIQIIENARVRETYDGHANFDGQIYYDGGLSNWATFQVTLGGQALLTPAQLALVRQLVEHVKPARCHLVNLRQYLFRYDGVADFDGARNFDGGVLA